jgi:photosystem II stability/assembly factor-like uncharacterized protein
VAADWSAQTLFSVTSGTVSTISLKTGHVATRTLSGNNTIMGSSIAVSHGVLYAPTTQGAAAVGLTGAPRVLQASGVATTSNLGIPVPAVPGELFMTRDGGRTWMRAPQAPSAQAVCASGQNVLTAQGSVVSRSVGGARWQVAFRAPVEEAPGLEPVLVCQGSRDALEITGWGAAMEHAAYIGFQSTNAGAAWTPAIEELYTHPGLPHVNAPEGPGTYPGPLAVTKAGEVIWSGISPAVPATAVGTVSGHAVRTEVVPGGQTPVSLAFPTNLDGYVLTGQGRLLATTTGGKTWRQAYPVSASPLETIAFVTPSLGYGLGTGDSEGAVLRTTDGGQRWTVVGSLPVKWPSGSDSLSFVNAQVGFAVVNGQELWETRDGGRRWVSRHVSATTVAFVGADGCAGSNQGYETSTNGGATWSSHHGVLADSVTACAAELARPGWDAAVAARQTPYAEMVGATGATGWFQVPGSVSLYRTGNTGGTWTRLLGSPALSIVPIQFSFASSGVGYLLTAAGALYRTTDGGEVWTLLAPA